MLPDKTGERGDMFDTEKICLYCCLPVRGCIIVTFQASCRMTMRPEFSWPCTFIDMTGYYHILDLSTKFQANSLYATNNEPDTWF